MSSPPVGKSRRRSSSQTPADDFSPDASILDDLYLAPLLKPPIITSKERFLNALERSFKQMRALIHSGSSFLWLFKKLSGFYKVDLLGGW
ncbi:hypothetical protein RclHR1_22300001 [Rhizophagus clarus]|uniref:Uncharacterized protein n=1 Tax=Rhizophagus clarus TaxID=94130 RepID=A0A2Z6R7S0_9GLOM|nr:hypothetical protein RclHR1_22300001 [Rhizophagus clarus]GES97705.1 hypothetical protein RCL_e8990_RclHR1_22300001 [Rhizophagus clarus]